jgi:hypothetical protein
MRKSTGRLMQVQADQLRVGDQLTQGAVVWVLPTPDQRLILVGLRPRSRPAAPSIRHLTKVYSAQDTVDVSRPH